MATLMTLNLYGASADYTTSETPDVTQPYFTSLADMTSIAVNIYDGGWEPKFEAEETIYADARTYVTKTIHNTWKVKIKYRNYPAAAAAIATYCPELAIVKMAYNWIKLDGHKIGFETADIAQAVNVTSWNLTKFHDLTMLEFEFSARRPE